MQTEITLPLNLPRNNMRIFAIALAILIMAIGVLAYTPPVSRDALTQHLVIPKLYLQAGKIYDLPELPSSYNPMNLDLLYMIPLYLGNDILAKYIHFLFALLSGWLIFEYLKKKSGKEYALLGVFFFLSIPVIVKLSITAYVDLGLVFFSTSALLCLFKWQEGVFKPRYLILSAMFCGLAMGTKYNGLIVFFLLTMLVPWLHEHSTIKPNGNPGHAVQPTLVYVAIAVAVFSPWMVRDAIWTGNPVYPLFDSFFNPNRVHAPVLGHFAVRDMVFHESWWQILLMPIRLFFQGQDGNPQFFDGRLNAALFILPWFAFLGNRSETPDLRAQKRILLVYSILFLLFAFLQTDLRARYVAPIIAPLVILSVFGLRNLLTVSVTYVSERFQRPAAVVVLACSLMIMLTPNISYLVQQFSLMNPVGYLSGAIDRNTYIQNFWPEYAADRHVNSTLPAQARILAFFLGQRAYYLQRNVSFNLGPVTRAIKQRGPAEEVLRALNEQQITHLMIRLDLFETWARNNFDDASREKLRQFLDQKTTRLFSQDGFAVYVID